MQNSLSGCSLMINHVLYQIDILGGQSGARMVLFIFNLENKPSSFLPEATVKPEYLESFFSDTGVYIRVKKVTWSLSGRCKRVKQRKRPSRLEHVDGLNNGGNFTGLCKLSFINLLGERFALTHYLWKSSPKKNSIEFQRIIAKITGRLSEPKHNKPPIPEITPNNRPILERSSSGYGSTKFFLISQSDQSLWTILSDFGNVD